MHPKKAVPCYSNQIHHVICRKCAAVVHQDCTHSSISACLFQNWSTLKEENHGPKKKKQRCPFGFPSSTNDGLSFDLPLRLPPTPRRAPILKQYSRGPKETIGNHPKMAKLRIQLGKDSHLQLGDFQPPPPKPHHSRVDPHHGELVYPAHKGSCRLEKQVW